MELVEVKNGGHPFLYNFIIYVCKTSTQCNWLNLSDHVNFQWKLTLNEQGWIHPKFEIIY